MGMFFKLAKVAISSKLDLKTIQLYGDKLLMDNGFNIYGYRKEIRKIANSFVEEYFLNPLTIPPLNEYESAMLKLIAVYKCAEEIGDDYTIASAKVAIRKLKKSGDGKIRSDILITITLETNYQD
jgi:hypothetical protein